MALTKVSRGLLSTSIVDNGNATAITINSSENVGIGDTVPDRKLHVNSGSSNVVAKFESTDAIAAIEFVDSTGSAEIGNSGNNLVFFPAGTERMRIDSSGNVGIGTSSISGRLEIKKATASNETLFGIEASGVTSTTLGSITYDQSDDSMRLLNNSQFGGTTLRLGTRGNDNLVIDYSGNLLVGTTANGNISSAHEIRGSSSSGGSSILTVNNTSGTAQCPALNVANTDASTDSSNRFVQFYADYTGSTATAMGGIVGNGASNVQFATISDVREKQNIEALTNSLDKITSLNPVEFDWITSGEHCKAGFIAQEVEEVFPEFVVENMASEGQEERKGLTGGMTGGIVAHLVKAIQEQQTLIESLTTRIAALEE
jgi:hypothetical protein